MLRIAVRTDNLFGIALVLPAAATRFRTGREARSGQRRGVGDRINIEQLDALRVPITRYPDLLLTQMLMASTDPLQAVAASRWLMEDGNKELQGRRAGEGAAKAELGRERQVPRRSWRC
jgi:hypothetical protein